MVYKEELDLEILIKLDSFTLPCADSEPTNKTFSKINIGWSYTFMKNVDNQVK